MAGAFAALESRPYRILWIGAVLSFLAFFTSTVVQTIVAFELTGTNRAVGFVVFGQGLAMAVAAPFGGALADRVSKRGLLFGAQSAATLVYLGLGLLLWADRLTVPGLALGSAAIGLCVSMLAPTRQALGPELVDEHRRGNAVALNQVALNVSRVAGPALAGALLAWPAAGAAGAYAAMAFFYALAVVSLAALPATPVRHDPDRGGVLDDVRQGVRYVAGHPRLRLVVPFFVLVIVVGFPYVTLLPGLVENQLGGSVDSIGWLFAVSALAGLAASVGAARLADSKRAPLVYTGMALLFGASLIAAAAAPTFATLALAMAMIGIGSGGFQTLNGAMLVRESEPAYVGRVMSLSILAFAGFGIAGLPIGLLADAVGERATLAGMGFAVCAVVLLLAPRILRSGEARIR